MVSDGSTDFTERAAAIDDPRVRVIALQHNSGKAVAINAALEQVQTEFVVFTDARQRFAPDALQRLLAPFADAQVGAVSGELEILDNFSESERPRILRRSVCTGAWKNPCVTAKRASAGCTA